MKCYYHPDLESVQGCSVCRKLLCTSCAHTIKSRVYCQDCLVAGADLAAMAVSPRFANYTPGRAALFAVIPGIGAVYNRQYVKAVLHFAIFAGLTIIAGSGPDIFGIAAFAFYVFTIIDAYRSAQAILRRAVIQPDVVTDEDQEVNVPIWGGVLVLLGVLFFLNNLRVFSLREMTEFLWPLFFVILGIYLVLDYYVLPKKKAPEVSNVPPPPVPPASGLDSSSSMNREENF